MLAKILKWGGISCLAGGYYYTTQHHRIPLRHPRLAQLITLLHQRKPEYAQRMFKLLLRLNLIAKDENLSKHILRAGFDTEGEYIEQIRDLGFAGIEIGPTCFNPSLEEDKELHLGILNAVANICTFQSKGNEHFRVQLSIAPNYQILKYTPYLMKENLLGSIDNFCKIQKRTEPLIVQQINVSFDRKDYSLTSSELQQVQKMVKDIKQTISEQMTVFNEPRKGKVAIGFGPYPQARYIDWQGLLGYMTGSYSL